MDNKMKQFLEDYNDYFDMEMIEIRPIQTHLFALCWLLSHLKNDLGMMANLFFKLMVFLLVIIIVLTGVKAFFFAFRYFKLRKEG